MKFRCLASGVGLAMFAMSGLLSPAVAQTVVMPNAAATHEGNSNNGFPFSAGSNRYQQIYAASEFSQVTAPVKVTQIAFRPDAGSSAFTTNFANVQFDLSTSQSLPTALNGSFAANVGPDDTIVRSGALTLSSSATGPASGPKGFDIIVTLTTPFLYNPANGNLLLDIRKFSAENTGQQFDTEDGSGVSSRNTSTNVNGDFGTVPGFSQALVTQFTFEPVNAAVPEPGSVALLVSGTLAGIGFASRRRK